MIISYVVRERRQMTITPRGATAWAGRFHWGLKNKTLRYDRDRKVILDKNDEVVADVGIDCPVQPGEFNLPVYFELIEL